MGRLIPEKKIEKKAVDISRARHNRSGCRRTYPLDLIPAHLCRIGSLKTVPKRDEGYIRDTAKED